MEEKRLGDYIDIAIQREEEAHDFYTDLFGRVEDASARESLKLLAGEELKHREFLIRYRDGGYRKDALRMNHPIDYKIAEHVQKPDIEGNLQSKDVYLIAAHRELNSYNFYNALAAIHPEGELKEMFRKIASEELKHKEKVEYLYTNTAFPQTDGG